MRVYFLILSVLCTSIISESTNYAGLPLIAIIMPPSPESPTDPNQTPRTREGNFVTIEESYSKYLSQSASMPLHIPYDMPQDRLISILDKTQAIYLTGMDTDLFDEKGTPTKFMIACQFILDYVVSQNKNGRFLPLLANGDGSNVIAAYFNQMKPDVLTCQEKGIFQGNSIVALSSNFSRYSKSYKQLDFNKTNNVMKSGELYFNSKCVITPSNFDHILSKDFYSFGTSQIGKSGISFVSIFEHKTYPIYANVFLSQVHQYEKLYTNHSIDKNLLEMVSFYIIEFADSIRSFSKNINDIGGDLQEYFESYATSQRTSTNIEGIYTDLAYGSRH